MPCCTCSVYQTRLLMRLSLAKYLGVIAVERIPAGRARFLLNQKSKPAPGFPAFSGSPFVFPPSQYFSFFPLLWCLLCTAHATLTRSIKLAPLLCFWPYLWGPSLSHPVCCCWLASREHRGLQTETDSLLTAPGLFLLVRPIPSNMPWPRRCWIVLQGVCFLFYT